MAKVKTASNPKKPLKSGKKPPKPTINKHEEINPSKFYYCSFCRKPSEQSRRLIAGPNNIFICDECVEVCVTVLYQENKKYMTSRLKRILSENNKIIFEDKKNKE